MFLQENQKADFTFLPLRKTIPFGKAKHNTQMLLSNVFPVNMKTFSLNGSIYSYYIVCEPNMPANNIPFLKEATKEMPSQIKKEIGFICQAGQMLWGSQKCEGQHSYNFTSKKGETKGKEYHIIVLPSQQEQFLNWKQMCATNEGTHHAQHLLQQYLQRRLQKDFDCVGNGFYFQKNIFKDVEDCSIYMGYKMTPLINTNKIYMKIDPTFRVIRHQNFLTTLKRVHKQDYKRFQDLSITTNYGNKKNYIIEKIQPKLTPRNYKIVNNGLTMSCSEYFSEKYGEKIHNLDQPLVRCKGFMKQTIVNGDKVREKVPIYLVPELCTLANVENVSSKTVQQMRLSPAERLQQCINLTKFMNNKKEKLFELQNNPLEIEALMIDKPDIIMNLDKKMEFRGDMMTINQNTQLLESHNLDDILYIYPDNLRFMIEKIDDHLVEIGQKFGTSFKNDYSVLNLKKWQNSESETYAIEVKKYLKKNRNFDLVIVLVDKYSYKFKHEIKKVITQQFSLPSQFISFENLNRKQQNFKSIMSKIVMQILSKVGSRIWEVKIDKILPPKYIPAVAGLSISKEKGNYNFKLVGSINKQLSKNTSINFQSHLSKEEKLQCLSRTFGTWIDEFKSNNKKVLPNLLIVYRDGLTFQQVQAQVKDEIIALKDAISKHQGYNPELVYVVVCNKENTRFYQKKGKSTILNCNPGTVYIDNKINDWAYEFYMQAHSVTRACAHPVFYRVALDESDLTQKELISLTHSQCYNYFNWAGAGKVPGCLQYNKKLTRFLQDTHIDLQKVPKLSNSPHFL